MDLDSVSVPKHSQKELGQYAGISASCFVNNPRNYIFSLLSLGSVFGIALLLSFGETQWKYFGWYLVSLSFFHFSEYVMVAKYCPDKLSTDSFLINHSPEYQIAAVASWVEFLLEWLLFPQLKTILLLNFLGILLMVGGEILRKLAMITAESNFTHLIQTRKERGHVLVTHGIYSLCRHPGYAGWFWWSIGKKARSKKMLLFTQPDVK